MNRRRIALAAGLALTLALLGGCAAAPQERSAVDLTNAAIGEPAPAPEADGRSARTYAATLYFLDASGERLVPVTRRLDVPPEETPAQAALWALLEGPIEGEDASWPDLGDARAEGWAEFSGEVATVSLPAKARALTPQALYAVRLAVAGTLTEFPGVSYVNVLVDGREEGVDLGATQSAGTLSRVRDLDVGAQYERRSAQGQEGRGFSLPVTLFFPTADGARVLASVRSVTFGSPTAIDGLYTMLTELGRASGGELTAQNVPAPMDYIVEMPDIVWAGEGAYRAVSLRFSASLDEALRAAGLTRGVYLAMLADTLLGFVPGVDGLLVSVGEEEVTGLAAEQTPDGEALSFERGMLRREDLLRYTASPVTLYAPDMQSGRVRAVRRALPQDRQADPRALLLAVQALGEEAGLWQGLGDADILAVYVQGDTVLVNLSGAFQSALAALTPDMERVAVYAMVNTLTQDGGAKYVAFYFEGRQVERLTGALEMRGRFLRNPGWVVD